MRVVCDSSEHPRVSKHSCRIGCSDDYPLLHHFSTLMVGLLVIMLLTAEHLASRIGRMFRSPHM
jgi:hypothetical protein